LAVDDSATMRKILEITFAGTDFQVTVVDNGNDALARLRAGGVGLVICDNSLDSDGYEVARQLRASAPGVPLLFLSSRQNPYDAGRGQGAGVTDNIDKPFDTQQLIDRATKLIQGGAGAGAAAPVAAAAAPAPAPAPAAAAAPQKQRTMMYGGAPAQPAQPAQPARAAGFGAGGLGSKPASPAPAPAAPKPAPAPAPAARQAAPVAAAAASAIAAGNGQLAAKMGELGLTPQQADAVLALSRDIVERVVWEVVPVLAETLIREEISRLTK
jgi:CheY-like chemotaxis protein